MFTDLNVFKMAQSMAVHAGQRQTTIAQNIANADTPGYQPRDLSPFAETYAAKSGTSELRTTRASHFGADSADVSDVRQPVSSIPDRDSNSVSIEQEMLKAVDVKRQHDRALAIYKSSLSILRTSIGRA